MDKKRMFFTYAAVAMTILLLLPSVTPIGAQEAMLGRGHEGVSRQDTTIPETIRRVDGPLSERGERRLQGNDLLSLLEDLLRSNITTRLNAYEKTTTIIFGATESIDVDDDITTGIDGDDISIGYRILPSIRMDPGLEVGLRFTLTIDRLTDELKEEDFALSALMCEDSIELGYDTTTLATSEMPESIELSITVFYDIAEATIGLTLGSDPVYSSSGTDTTLNLHGAYNTNQLKRNIAFSLSPAVATQATLCSTPSEDTWEYRFSRESATTPPKLTMSLSTLTDTQGKETTVVLDPLPESISFSLTTGSFQGTGGSIVYQSDSSHDIDMLITTERFNNARYVRIDTLPQGFSAQWVPTQTDGYLHLEVTSTGSTLSITDALIDPEVNLTLSRVGDLDITTTWDLTNPGALEITKDPSLTIDVYIRIAEWMATLEAEPTAEKIDVAWNINTSDGYLYLDTDGERLSTIDLLIQGEDRGLQTQAETFQAQDFQLNWTLWPPSEFGLDHTGTLFFLSLSMDLYIDGQWHHLWPWL